MVRYEPDSSQRDFIDSPHDRIRLLAPAGSGKTASILWRCVQFARNLGPRQKILLVAFTRVASAELKARIRTEPELFGLKDKLEVTTLNAWAWRRLKNQFRGAQLLTEDGKIAYTIRNLLRPVYTQFPDIAYAIDRSNAFRPRSFLDLIDRIKGMGFRHDLHVNRQTFNEHVDWLKTVGLTSQLHLSAEQFIALEIIDESDETDVILDQFYSNFFEFWRQAITRMHEAALFTLEDQKYCTYIDLSGSPVSSVNSGTKYVHVLVDEFQDINTLDVLLLREISRHHAADITVVGDDDQAIYEWRGATPRFILDPEMCFQQTYETMTLERNYRSPRNIVDISQRLISHNANRVPKEVVAVSDRIAEVEVRTVDGFPNTVASVTELVNEILRRETDESVALISRTRSQIVPYQVVFASKEWPFSAAEDLNLFLSHAFESLRNLILIKANPDDPYLTVERFMDLCNSVRRYPLNKDVQSRLSAYLSTAPRSATMRQLLGHFLQFSEPLARNAASTSARGRIRGEIADAIDQFLSATSVSQTIDAVSDRFAGLQKNYGKSLDDIFHADPPFLFMSEYAASYGDDYEKFAGDLQLAKYKLAQVTDQYADEENDDSIQQSSKPAPRVLLMTALRAKGKEFDNVIILDANERLWPHHLAKTPEAVEEERRLFYVAITRAKQRLYLINNKRMLGEVATPSPFLAEAGLGA